MTLLRPARSTDAGKVGAILSEFVATTDWMPQLHTGAEDVAHAGVLIERGWVTIAEKAGAVVGFSACQNDDLDALYVRADARGQGVGTAMLEALQSNAARLALWTFEANTRAQTFYTRHGFVETERGDGSGNDEGLPDIKYLWERED